MTILNHHTVGREQQPHKIGFISIPMNTVFEIDILCAKIELFETFRAYIG
jgi:hypothetical protein